MSNTAGVYVTTKKNGDVYYRSSITIKRKHISLGSYEDSATAGRVYSDALMVVNSSCGIDDYESLNLSLPYKKYVTLVNFRDNSIYIKTPIYLRGAFFTYHLAPDDILYFDRDDLFYYSNHSIMRRKGHLFVADFGMQVNILSRYGIKEHAVCGRDYFFVNKDNHDLRYHNIVITNRYYGVTAVTRHNVTMYKAKIHIKGDYVIGIYNTPEEAAIAYNKAADILREKGLKKSFPENYPESLSAISYASIYNSIKISSKIREFSV